MRSRMVRELEDWIERTFTEERGVERREVLRRAKGARLPSEEIHLLERLPQATQTPRELVDEIDRIAAPHEIGGSAGGMDAGSSGEMRPGAYGAPPERKKGGDQMGGYQP
ncbi:MAG TPA: hypothetical protein VGK50_01555 [Coriobacteriia bacterium]